MNNLIKILTSGSVDDGKSTLLGHLLSNINAIYDDQMDNAYDNGVIDYSLLLDGLSSEREQKITIDVCYRYFYLNNNKIILADVPGHEQYTHNMITAATFADLAIILIDARNGILQQTKRHSYLLHMLGIKDVIIAVNKMDIVNYSEEIFNIIKDEYDILNSFYNFNIKYIPISALIGDNITEKSNNMLWYSNETIYESILSINSKINNKKGLRFPIQYVFKHNDDRYYCGKITGEIKIGDEIVILPSNKKSKVTSIYANGIKKEKCLNENVSITLDNKNDISRGDIIIKDTLVYKTNNILSKLIWFDEKKFNCDRNYYIKHLNKLTKVKIYNNYKIDINKNINIYNTDIIKNDIFVCNLELSNDIICTKYINGKKFGSFIVIDPETNDTCGAGIIEEINNDKYKNDNMLLNINNIATKKEDIDIVIKTVNYINEKFGLNIKIK